MPLSKTYPRSKTHPFSVLPVLLSVPLLLGACSSSDAQRPTDGDLPTVFDAEIERSDEDGSRDGPGAADGAADQRVDGTPPAACGAIVTFEQGKAPSKELHVATTGSDSQGDGTVGKPYATIGGAAKAAIPGTAIRVHAGTYAGGISISNLAGTAAAPIWIGGAPGEAKPVIDGGAEAMHLSKVRYLIVHDLEIRHQSANGINCDDGGAYADIDATRYVVFRELELHDVGGSGNQDCLKLSGVDDYFVLDSTFERCGGGQSGSAIDHVGCHDGLIARNTFRDLKLSGNAVQCKGGSTSIEIRANLMLDAGARAVNIGGSTGFQYFRPPLSSSAENAEARNIRVIANVIRGATTPLAFVGCVDCLVANNTIIDPDKWLLRVLQETTSSGGYAFAAAANGRVLNNIFYFSRAATTPGAEVNIGPNTAPATFTFAHNLWFAHDQPASSAPTLPVAETGGVIGQDPALATPSATLPDAQISASSPAASAGQVLAEVPGDYLGACFATPPSIGAHQAR